MTDNRQITITRHNAGGSGPNEKDVAFPARPGPGAGASTFGTSRPRAERGDIKGLVERVTFHNAVNGLRVLRIKARGNRDGGGRLPTHCANAVVYASVCEHSAK